MPLQTISQSGFIRGLNASVDRVIQPKGSVPRLSNMLLTHRGGLVTCDGSANVFTSSGVSNTFIAIGLFQPQGLPTYVTGLGQTTGRTVSLPGGSAAAGTYGGVTILSAVRVNPTPGVGGSGGLTTVTTSTPHGILGGPGTLVNISGMGDSTFNGSFPIWTIPSTTTFTCVQIGGNATSGGGTLGGGSLAGSTTYFYKLTAVDAPFDPVALLSTGLVGSGQTTPGSEFTVATGANNFAIITIAASSAAAGFLLYRSTTTNTEKLVTGYIPNTNPGGSVTAWDLGYTMAFPSISPPGSNTTATTTFYSFSGTSAIGNTYSASNIITDLPKLKINAISTPPGGYDGNYVNTNLGSSLIWTPFGGAQGTVMPIPFMFQFINKQILILGNGYPPMQFDGQNVTALAGGSGTAPAGAVAGVVYAGSLWVGNTAPYDLPNGLDGPSAIRMSDSNNPNSWTNANSAFLSKDDGSQITGMATFTIAESGIIPTGSLVVFKEYSTYQVTGVFGASNFTIQQAQTDMGCVAPGTIQFVPGFGIVRLSHLGWAVFDGVRDRLLSEELRPYIFLDLSQQWLSTPFASSNDINPLDWAFAYRCTALQTSTPALYVSTYPTYDNGIGAGIMRNAFAFDLVLKAWTPIAWFNGNAAGVHDTIVLRPQASLPIALISDTSGNIQRWQAGDETWIGNVPVNWSVRTPEVIGKQPTDRLFIRRLLVRGTNLSSSSSNFTTPTVIPILDRVPQTLLITKAPTALLRTLPSAGNAGTEFQLDIGIAPGRIVTSASCLLNGSGRVELDSFDWMVMPRPAGRPVVIS